MGNSSCDFGVIECRLGATHSGQRVLNAEENQAHEAASAVAHLAKTPQMWLDRKKRERRLVGKPVASED
ncbi:unnamed protein product [Tetraodon nigroviridis]|uniref:(spotted green pufferfish) hypothetical protein n=1 Tax=Tetraodon nigroviridis TaxID=99883 RepID=Q4S8X4_TETNG|nr:unnamed protein product [Tetraodon nigroviridis]